jgi:hypothetical protein
MAAFSVFGAVRSCSLLMPGPSPTFGPVAAGCNRRMTFFGMGTSMKVHINIDCTPEEARTFFGLPDVTAAQEELVAEATKRMKANMAAMDMETLMKTWMPMGLQGIEKIQRSFFEQMSKAMSAGRETK